MARWIRFEHGGIEGYGTVEGETVHVHRGDPIRGDAQATGETVPLDAVRLLNPVRPSKFFGLVNNFREGVARAGLPVPAEPLYFLKPPSCHLAPGAPIRLPAQDVGKVIYEGELGIVIGREARAVAEADADRYIFGFTCVNDVTALDLLTRDPSFAQWTRAKSFDTFGPFGPVIATGIDPSALTVRTLVKGKVRQEYPCSDMIFGPRALVSRLSCDSTLLPGDLIACGTSVGIGVLRPGSTVEVVIDGIGTLANPVVAAGEGA
jgi:2-keto-4-pentenoate hydratase/2-oxohepta-3-ene-1,7-dioic acid hydratase in catechol pathway